MPVLRSAVPAEQRPDGPALPSAANVAALRPVRESLQWFRRERNWISERHLQVCRIAAPTFFEQKRAEWMASQFRALGCLPQIDRAGNVVAFLNANSHGPFLAVTAHLDTVLAPRREEDIHYGADGRLYGPGVSDNGAGLAGLLAIAAAVKANPELEDLLSNIVLIANVGEEGEGNLSGMRYLCRQSPNALALKQFLVLDGPSTEHITSRALASRRFDIVFTGPGGHSWSDAGCANPVHALSRAITLFTEHRAVMLPQPSSSPRSSFNFGIIDGGTSINSIPSQARSKVDLRSESPAKLEEMATLLHSCVDRAIEVENDRSAQGGRPLGRVQAAIREIGSRPGGGLADDSPLLLAIRAADSHLGIRAILECASTDANIPLSLGIPAVSIGTGGKGGGAHTPQEWFHAEGRETGLQRILLTLCLLSA
ncbi:MAG: M20/M25/M40 family metallo-hydrolase [Acidobacteria bacterium]|nr:M20/M25/M40 family metallo-hydrolase [Acidobacteriota bacterium]